jgi:hypothetical protein
MYMCGCWGGFYSVSGLRMEFMDLELEQSFEKGRGLFCDGRNVGA